MRPDRCALVPEMYSVQSRLLSSIQRSAAFFLTMWLTIGGSSLVGMFGLIGGLKAIPSLGGRILPLICSSRISHRPWFRFAERLRERRRENCGRIARCEDGEIRAIGVRRDRHGSGPFSVNEQIRDGLACEWIKR